MPNNDAMPESHITKESVQVEPGQVWKDLDKRMNGRHVRVISVAKGKALVARTNPDNGWTSDNTSKLSVRRMQKSMGWVLVLGSRKP